MNLQLNIALSTLQMSPADRTEGSVESVANWLREKSKLFKPLDDSILTDVARNCSLQHFPADHVLIRQGEIGDCFYIILQGQVSVYICTDLEPGQLAGIKEEGGDRTDDAKTELDRALFGKHIVNLGIGAGFGELALINKDCIRNASVITNEPCHFICIDRTLYNRSLKAFQTRDFEDRNYFIETHPLFSKWPWGLKRQVAMSLERATYDFENIISKQGQQVSTLYFIVRGTVRLVYDCATLNTIANGQVPRPSIQYDMGDDGSNNSGSRGNSAVGNHNSNGKSQPFFRNGGDGSSNTPHPEDVCQLANNEIIGDFEVLYPLDFYLFTAFAAAETEILSLSVKNMMRFLESKSLAKVTLDLFIASYRRLGDRVEKKAIKCQLLTTIFNNARQIVECAEAKRDVEEMNRIKRAQLLSQNATRQVRANSVDFSTSKPPPIIVTPPTEAFRRFIRQDVDVDDEVNLSRPPVVNRQMLEAEMAKAKETKEQRRRHSNAALQSRYLAELAKKIQDL